MLLRMTQMLMLTSGQAGNIAKSLLILQHQQIYQAQLSVHDYRLHTSTSSFMYLLDLDCLGYDFKNINQYEYEFVKCILLSI